MVTRNNYFFHLFCPYVKHFKKKNSPKKQHQKSPTWANHISGILMMSGDLQKSTQNAELNSENVSLLVYSPRNNYKKKETTVITTRKKKPLVARSTSVRQLTQCISEDCEEWSCLCPQAFIADLVKTVTVSLPRRFSGNKQRDKGLVLNLCLVLKHVCNPYLFQSLDGEFTHAASSEKGGKEFFAVVVYKSIMKSYPVAQCR